MTASRQSHWLPVAGIILAALVVRGYCLGGKRIPSHDGAISYLAATAHQDDFEQIQTTGRHPYGDWVRAQDWQRLWQVDHRWAFSEIQQNLANYDMHPPLYFWLLHVWCLVVGVHAWSGPLLHMPLMVLSGLALYYFARSAGLGAGASAASLALWAFSPSTLRITLQARPYELLTLFTLLLAILSVRASHRSGLTWTSALAIAAVTLMGMLTHLYFIWVAMGGAIVLLVKRDAARGFIKRTAFYCAAVATGTLVSLAINPLSPISLARQEAKRQAADLAAVPQRIEISVNTLAGFLVMQQGLKSVVMAGLGLALIAGIAVAVRRRGMADRWVANLRSVPPAPTVFLLSVTIPILALYFSFISPVHAVGYRYLSMTWPFLGVLIGVSLWDAGGRLRGHILAALLVLQVASGLALGLSFRRGMEEGNTNPGLALASGAVVVDNVERGVLTEILWTAHPDKRVFVATQDDLLADPGSWIPQLGPAATYVSDLRKPKIRHAGRFGVLAADLARVYSASKRREILELIRSHGYDVTPEGDPERIVSAIFHLRQRSAPSLAE